MLGAALLFPTSEEEDPTGESLTDYTAHVRMKNKISFVSLL